MMKRWVLAWMLMWASPLALGAAVEVRSFADPVQQSRYEELVRELRCLVCQNQSLAESDADLAKDLRTEVFRIIESGKSDEEAVEFLVSRYGDFVLYRPPFKPLTLLLWGGPLALFLLVGLMMWRQYARRRAASEEPPLSTEQQERLRRLEKDLPDDSRP